MKLFNSIIGNSGQPHGEKGKKGDGGETKAEDNNEPSPRRGSALLSQFSFRRTSITKDGADGHANTAAKAAPGGKVDIPDEKPSDAVVEQLFADLILPEVPVERQGACEQRP